MANSGAPAGAFTDNSANGDVVPMPTLPAEVIVVVPVPPKYAVYAESCVDEAFAANCCSPVQVFGCDKAREAMTAPLVGEIVNVPSLLETELTPPVRHVPPMAKHPPERFSPTLDVEVAKLEMFRPRMVVVPVGEISRAEMEVVANVVGEAD